MWNMRCAVLTSVVNRHHPERMRKDRTATPTFFFFYFLMNNGPSSPTFLHISTFSGTGGHLWPIFHLSWCLISRAQLNGACAAAHKDPPLSCVAVLIGLQQGEVLSFYTRYIHCSKLLILLLRGRCIIGLCMTWHRHNSTRSRWRNTFILQLYHGTRKPTLNLRNSAGQSRLWRQKLQNALYQVVKPLTHEIPSRFSFLERKML